MSSFQAGYALVTIFSSVLGIIFIIIGNIGKLVGVISKTKILKNDVTKQDEMYLGETTALPMSLVYDIIEKFEKDNP